MLSAPFQTSEDQEITPREAQEVMVLWARLSENQGLGASTSVRDISEALNASPAVVSQLLQQVRSKSSKSTSSSAAKDIFKWLGIGILAIGVMIGIFGTGFQFGRQREVNFRYSAPVSMTPPAGYVVTFDGDSIVGENQSFGPFAAQPREKQLENALQGAVYDMYPSQRFYSGPPLDRQKILTALNKQQNLDGLLEFRDASVTFGKLKSTGKIPVALVDDPQLRADVEADQSRHIKQIVSSLVLQESEQNQKQGDLIAPPRPSR